MILSLVLFALGVGMISILLLINQQVNDKFDKNLAGIDLVIGAKGSPLQLILGSMYHIDNPTGNISLKEARPFLNPKHPLIKRAVPMSLGDSHQGYRIIGTSHDMVDLYKGEIAEGRIWQNDFEVNVGANIANKLGMKIGDTFHSSHGFDINEDLVHSDGRAFEVVGIFKPSGSVLDQVILTNTQSVWAVHDSHDHGDHTDHDHSEDSNHAGHNHGDHGHSHDGHDHDHEGHSHNDHTNHDHAEAPIGLAPGTDINNTPTPKKDHTKTITLLDEDENKEITSILIEFKANNFQSLNMPRSINENTNMQAAKPAWELNRLYSMMGVGEEFLRKLALIIVLVSAFSIFISLFSSLKDRKYELALMRVMGASQGKLFLLIILEGLILAVIGYVIGIGLSHLGMEILAGQMEDEYKYSFTGSTFLIEEIYLLIGALLTGFVAAIIPAFQAFNTDISETLSKG